MTDLFLILFIEIIKLVEKKKKKLKRFLILIN